METKLRDAEIDESPTAKPQDDSSRWQAAEEKWKEYKGRQVAAPAAYEGQSTVPGPIEVQAEDLETTKKTKVMSGRTKTTHTFRIVTITSVLVHDGKPAARRCWGFRLFYLEAVQDVIRNIDHIADKGYYQYIVVEEFQEGLLVEPLREQWFYVTKNADGEVACSESHKPECLKDHICFAMG